MQLYDLNRRAFIIRLGGAAGCMFWGAGGAAPAGERPRRVGVLMGLAADDPESQARLAAFAQGLQRSGWVVGENLQVEYRWGAGDPEQMRKHALELAASAPDVILAHSSAAVAPLLQATRSIPIVFTLVADPVGAGFVRSLARPGGNVTGITNFEFAASAVWLELLKEIAPSVTRVAVLRESAIAAGPGQFGAIQARAPALGVDLAPIDLREAGQIEHDITVFSQRSNAGLIVTGSPAATVYRGLIIQSAARLRLPAVYNSSLYASSGGLLSYGPDFVEPFWRAAEYVDRILKGESPAELSVQRPAKYQLVLNTKTAKALGLDIPAKVLARADKLIE
jgi:putative tryptophan/tyrosine transport system substrate-binding protein